MPAFLETALQSWSDCGPLLFPLAAVSFAMLYLLVRSRLELGHALKITRENGAAPDGSQEISGRVRRDILLIGALAGAAPLLGLLGTVTGMIHTFSGVHGADGAISGQVADGIRQALITTQLGLLIAIPGLFGLARLRRLLDQLAILQELSEWTQAR